MFSIGNFARLGQVSVRMLRHYDAIGLLRPAHVDPGSGYRFYDADQLQRLDRIVALKDLGFTLQQVQTILDEVVNAAELRGMLRLRRAELKAQLSGDEHRLGRVETRLRWIEGESCSSTHAIVLKRVPMVRIAQLTATAASYAAEHIGPALQPLYGQLAQRLQAAGLSPTGPAIAYYEPSPGMSRDTITVHAAFPIGAEPGLACDFSVLDLPEIPEAATLIHHGSMDEVGATFRVLARWIEDNGYRAIGFGREVYVESWPKPPESWVTELQVTIRKG
jgi:DNA-binding transcriptional MerR regulator